MFTNCKHGLYWNGTKLVRGLELSPLVSDQNVSPRYVYYTGWDAQYTCDAVFVEYQLWCELAVSYEAIWTLVETGTCDDCVGQLIYPVCVPVSGNPGVG